MLIFEVPWWWFQEEGKLELLMSRQFSVLSLSFFIVLSSVGLSRAGSMYIGYTEPSGDNSNIAYDNDVAITNTATTAQTTFLSHLQGYYYEDFQEVASNPETDTKTDILKLTDLASDKFNFTFKSHGNLGGETTPTGSLTASVPKDVTFQLGPIQPNSERGVYDGTDVNNKAYELAPAVPGTTLTDADNWFASVDGPSPGDTLTLNFAPGQDAVGLMLNDIVTPSADEVTVNFDDGSQMELTDGITAGNGEAGHTNQYSGLTLGNNNVLFFGYIGTKSISNVVIDLGNDGITLDNIYVSNSVPLPTVACTFLTLFGIVAGFHRFKRLGHTTAMS